MKLLLTLLATLFISFSAYAAETCEKCMARCPHETKDIRDCDRGCPGVCKKAELVALKKAQSCQACLSECPHATRDLRSCDMGCTEECDRDALYGILKKNMAKKGCGLEGGASRAGNDDRLIIKPSVDKGFEMDMGRNVDPGFNMDMGGANAR